MFSSARLKLTLGYSLLIVVITSFFSFLLHVSVSSEINEGFRRAQMRYRAQELGVPVPRDPGQFRRFEREYVESLDFEEFEEDLHQAHMRVMYRLLLINGVIWFISSGLAYFFAGKTLAPIEKVHMKQKQFISDASHELRTPLTALKTSLQVDIRDKQLTKLTRSKLNSYLDEVNQVVDLSNSLLALAQIDEKQIELKIVSVSIKTLVKKLEGRFSSQLQKKSLLVTTDFSIHKIKTDKDLFFKLLQIVFDNAVKYSKPNTSITISTKKSSNNTVRISIEDQGVGIEKSQTSKVFDRFYRADSSRNTSGHGIGLSLAKSVTGILGGNIVIESMVNKGTRVQITLPLNSKS